MRTEAGRFTVPLALHEGAAEEHAPLTLILTADEAVALRDQLSAVLTSAPDGGAA